MLPFRKGVTKDVLLSGQHDFIPKNNSKKKQPTKLKKKYFYHIKRCYFFAKKLDFLDNEFFY